MKEWIHPILAEPQRHGGGGGGGGRGCCTPSASVYSLQRYGINLILRGCRGRSCRCHRRQYPEEKGTREGGRETAKTCSGFWRVKQ